MAFPPHELFFIFFFFTPFSFSIYFLWRRCGEYSPYQCINIDPDVDFVLLLRY